MKISSSSLKKINGSMETEYEKNIRIRKELHAIDKEIHDMYLGSMVCKCTNNNICKEFVNVMSKNEMDKYINLEYLSQEQKEWVITKFILEQNKD